MAVRIASCMWSGQNHLFLCRMTPALSNGWHWAVLFGVGCALFVHFFVRLGAPEITRLLLKTGWYFATALTIYLGHQLVRAVAYWVCVQANGRRSYWDLVGLRLSGEAVQFLTVTGPFLAEPAKIWLLSQHGVSTKHAVAATLCEYLIYTFTSAVLAIVGLMCLLGNFQLSAAVALSAKALILSMSTLLVVAGWAIARRIYLIGGIIKLVKTLPFAGKYMKLADQDVRDTEDVLLSILRDRPLRFFSIVSIEFAAQALLVIELFVFLWPMGESVSLLNSFIIEAATKFIGFAFFFIPGQMGAAEGAYALVVQSVGLSASVGFALAVARRLRNLIVVGLGLVLAPLWKGTRANPEQH